MKKVPLYIRIRKESHRKIAYAQDLIVEEVYKEFDKPILHGGTAIWRCYEGKRFSEDLDFYLPRNKDKINRLFASLEKKGFQIIRKKVSANSIYSELRLARVSVRLEATFQRAEGIIADYEMLNGNMISIYSLAPETIILEKVKAYLKRLKVRDLWDIFFLLRHVKDAGSIKGYIAMLIKGYKKPFDEQDLKALIMEGIVPSAGEMIEYIKRKWENKYI